MSQLELEDLVSEEGVERVKEYVVVLLPPELRDAKLAEIDKIEADYNKKIEDYTHILISRGHCMADNDGDCSWIGCPQTCDGEPKKSGRWCPRDRKPDKDS